MKIRRRPLFDTQRPFPAFQWTGSKYERAPWYCGFIPEHVRWVDLFCGTAAMTTSKTPSEVEILNDLDGHIVSFFRVLQDPEAHKLLLHRIDNSVPARSMHDAACDLLRSGAWENEGERAFAFWVKHTICAPMRPNAFYVPKAIQRHRNPAHYGHKLTMVRRRIQKCVIENMDALTLIDRLDEPNTCFFVDPPYEGSNQDGYAHKADDDFHERLVERLLMLEGKAMLCGYSNSRYDRLACAGWRSESIEVISRACCFVSGSSKKRTEWLWIKDWSGTGQPPPFTKKYQKDWLI